jgi:hypothetical protein
MKRKETCVSELIDPAWGREPVFRPHVLAGPHGDLLATDIFSDLFAEFSQIFRGRNAYDVRLATETRPKKCRKTAENNSITAENNSIIAKTN